MLEGPLGGALGILATTAVGALVIGAVLYARPLATAAIRLARRLHLLAEPPAPPIGMPLERIARDLRRLRPQTVHAPGTPVARHRGVLRAYDDVLTDACHALEIETDLPDLPEGLARDTERLRVEVELERAGIRLQEP